MFSPDSMLPIFFRWVHLVSGVIWLGHLYHVNLVQMPFIKEIDPVTRRDVILKLLPRALFWRRWGAVVTLLSGIGLMLGGQFRNPAIMIGATLGLIMFLNVWLMIWPNQKAIIRTTTEADAAKTPVPPEAGYYALRVYWVTRLNFWLSFPMLFFMSASSHFPPF